MLHSFLEDGIVWLSVKNSNKFSKLQCYKSMAPFYGGYKQSIIFYNLNSDRSFFNRVNESEFTCKKKQIVSKRPYKKLFCWWSFSINKKIYWWLPGSVLIKIILNKLNQGESGQIPIFLKKRGVFWILFAWIRIFFYV